jgi:anti-sigma B factor antagonist
MEINIRESDNIKIMDLNGNLDTNTAPDVESQLSRLIDKGTNNILINLEKLEYISSAGLRVFLATGKRIKSVGGKFELCHLNETVQEVFDMSGFSTILNVYKDENEALKEF